MKVNEFKLMVVAGHGQGDPGACGNGHKEANINRDLADRIVKYAISKGINVTLYDPNLNAVTQCKQGNVPQFAGHHYCLEIHCNASSKDTSRGTMFYVHKDEVGCSVEQNILNRLYALGTRKCWDGIVNAFVQFKTGLIVQNRCKAQGVSHGLLETFFITNKDDVNWYFTKKDDIAREVVEGIIEGFGLETDIEAPTYAYNNWIGTIVDCDTLNVRAGGSMAYEVVNTLPAGINVEVFGETSDGWLNIRICDDVLGWVFNKYVKRV